MSDLVHVKKGYAPKLRSGFIKYDIYESFGEIFVAMVHNYQKGTHSTLSSILMVLSLLVY